MTESVGRVCALVQAVEPLGEVWVVAPDQGDERVSHAITLGKPARHRLRGQGTWFAVSGTPTDCVYLALHHFMKGAPAGRGDLRDQPRSNLGTDAHYSGTVSAAHEGMVNGIPSVALFGGLKALDFTKAAQFAGRLTCWVGDHGLPPGVMLNCNVPQVTDGRYALCAVWGHAATSVSAVHRRPARRRLLLDRRHGGGARGSL